MLKGASDKLDDVSAGGPIFAEDALSYLACMFLGTLIGELTTATPK